MGSAGGQRNVGLVLSLALLVACQAQGESFWVGVGSADVTGPAADVNMMGYAKPGQTAAGIHIRLRSRAFVFAAGAGGKRAVFVSVDACMASQAVTTAVAQKLRTKYGGLYTEENVAVSGIHTHSGPGGYLEYVLYGVTSLGFVKESFEALVEGIVASIDQAHARLRPASLRLGEAPVMGTSINRSPTAYLLNPPEERAMYKGDVDTTLVQLTATAGGAGGGGGSETLIGAVNWFPVHCTSMNNSNTLISGDNKGAASQMLEEVAGAGAGVFVAAFAQGAVGDTSPNTGGAFCTDTGEPCDAATSTCGGRSEKCHGRGPAWPDHFESTRIIAEKQAQAAASLLAPSPEQRAVDPALGLDYRHSWLDMRNVSVLATPFTRAGRTCRAAMGFSFAAGTTDGPGAFDFTQGDTSGNAFWRAVRGVIKAPSAEQVACHAPKPILLDTGEMSFPYPWQPNTVAVQLLRVGDLLIACAPGELTTMAGRRLRRAVLSAWAAGGGRGTPAVVVAGLCNTYSSYVATPEEYQAQRYEGASTIFGPHTLGAYIQAFAGMARAMAAGTPYPAGDPPPDLLPRQLSFLPPVLLDEPPPGGAFGDVAEDVPAGAPLRAGGVARAVFHSACPRSHVHGGSFLAVERLLPGGGGWVAAHVDGDWCTRFRWWRPEPTLAPARSLGEVEWHVPVGTPPGIYRLRHSGSYKRALGGTRPFTGVSRRFTVS